MTEEKRLSLGAEELARILLSLYNPQNLHKGKSQSRAKILSRPQVAEILATP